MFKNVERLADRLSLNYSEKPVRKIGNTWHESDTFEIDVSEAETLEDVLVEIEGFVDRNISQDAYLVDLNLFDGTSGLPETVFPQFIVPREESVASLQKVGTIEDLESIIYNHHETLLEELEDDSPMPSAGYNIGDEVTLQNQIKDIDLSDDGDANSFFYFSFERKDKGFDITLESRTFVRDNVVYEVQ